MKLQNYMPIYETSEQAINHSLKTMFRLTNARTFINRCLPGITRGHIGNGGLTVYMQQFSGLVNVKHANYTATQGLNFKSIQVVI